MTCICKPEYLRRIPPPEEHSALCDIEHNKHRGVELYEAIKWETQDHPCSGVGFSHGPHGKCPGYTRDRT